MCQNVMGVRLIALQCFLFDTPPLNELRGNSNKLVSPYYRLHWTLGISSDIILGCQFVTILKDFRNAPPAQMQIYCQKIIF